MSADLSAQDLADTLWATCFLCTYAPDVARRLLHALAPRLHLLGDGEECSQLHMFFVAMQVEAPLRAGTFAALPLAGYTRRLYTLAHSLDTHRRAHAHPSARVACRGGAVATVQTHGNEFWRA